MSPAAGAADWPQWRGPSRNGCSPETGLLARWPVGGPKLAWVADSLGVGYAGPAVVGGRVYVAGGVGGKEQAFALDAASGKVAWQTPLGPLFTNSFGDGPRATPAVAGDAVFVLTGKGVLACLDKATGAKRWVKDFRTDLGGGLMRGGLLADWGYSGSPLVDGGRVVVCPGGPKGTVAALDSATGAVLWRTDWLKHNASYASPVPAELHGVRQYVVFTGGNELKIGGLMPKGDGPRLVGVRAADGAELWSFEPTYKMSAVAPDPVMVGDKVFVTCGFNAGCSLASIPKPSAGGPVAASAVYRSDGMKNYHGGVIVKDGRVFGFSELAGWTCLDLADGEVLWERRNRSNSGALAWADGRLYAVGDDGRVFLLGATDKGWDEQGHFDLPRKSAGRAANRSVTVCTHPVIANGRLYVRDQELLYCYDVRGGK